MKSKHNWRIAVTLTCTVAILGVLVLAAGVQADHKNAFEVWVMDQSNSRGTTSGGTLHIYNGRDLIRRPSMAAAEVIDLGGALQTQCIAETEAAPIRAHIVLFNGPHTHAIISFVASGHVVFLDAATRAPIKCLRMSVGANGARQAHAAFPAPNDRYVIVANQNGKLLERIDTDADGDGVPYESASDIVHDTAATLNLASCVTPNGLACETPGVAPRPNNAVICPIIDRTSRLTFATLGGGGLLVADTSLGGTVPPIVAEYDNTNIHPHGCGGMQAGTTTASRIYLNTGAGGDHPFEADLYSFPVSGFPLAPAFNAPNTPAPTTIFSFDTEGHDSHGMLLNRKTEHGDRFLWAADRAANVIEVVDASSDAHVHTFSLVGKHSADPAPDLMDLSPDGRYAFISLRGPCPLTANVAGVNNAVGATPGVAVVKVKHGGLNGRLKGIAPINRLDHTITSCAPAGAPASNNRADPHGIIVRRK